jgi:hypothetical protein
MQEPLHQPRTTRLFGSRSFLPRVLENVDEPFANLDRKKPRVGRGRPTPEFRLTGRYPASMVRISPGKSARGKRFQRLASTWIIAVNPETVAAVKNTARGFVVLQVLF